MQLGESAGSLEPRNLIDSRIGQLSDHDLESSVGHGEISTALRSICNNRNKTSEDFTYDPGER